MEPKKLLQGVMKSPIIEIAQGVETSHRSIDFCTYAKRWLVLGDADGEFCAAFTQAVPPVGKGKTILL